jgi:phosphoribosylaminoimidazolecarboxamide formyltransferase/IMP cyclohydrolase
VKPRALLSVSDKRGLAEFARGLVESGWELVSTGGTARALRDAGLPVKDVSDVTGHPEMMDGRVKTLHPAVHAGLLARRERSDDLDAMRRQGYHTIDLLAVNLYPFHQAVARNAPLTEAMEQVDIGGPAMLRAAAKNHGNVIAVVDPADYAEVLAAVHTGSADDELRRRLATKVFQHTSRYDAAIAKYFESADASVKKGEGETGFPDGMTLRLSLVQTLRYGENPDQPAAFYSEDGAPAGSLPYLRQLHGKELSFNNLLDVEAAVTAVSAFHDAGRAACVIIKHTTPCGVALGDSAENAYRRALECDPVSAFGGIVGFNCAVSRDAAHALSDTFLEIVVAPDFAPSAVEVLTRKKNLRLIVLPVEPAAEAELDFKRVRGGFLVQSRMRMEFPEDEWLVVTRRAPDAGQMQDLRFAWRVAASVKSNAIVLARDACTIGIGAGQMSRVDSSRIAVMKAADTGAKTAGAVLASDAFFPFRDGIDAAAEAAVAAVIQPGGSVRDAEVIAAADQHGIAMVFTARRVFRH